MKNQLNNRIALVTGGNRGIGFEICRQLGSARMTVVLTARNEKAGSASAGILKKEKLDVIYHQLDVTKSKSISALAEFMQKEFGTLDVLVNNAGISLSSKNSLKSPVVEMRETFDTNFFGAVELTQALAPLLEKSKDARVINVSSGMGSITQPASGYLAYRSSKAALNSFTVFMAADLHNSNIKVNAMCPGWVRSDMGGQSAPRSLEQGADTALWLANEPNIPSGKFFRDRKQINW